MQCLEVELTHCTASLERKDKTGDRKKKGEVVGKGEREAEDLYRPNKTKRGERDYSDEILAQPSQVTNGNVENLDIGCQHRIQILKEALAKGP